MFRASKITSTAERSARPVLTTIEQLSARGPTRGPTVDDTPSTAGVHRTPQHATQSEDSLFSVPEVVASPSSIGGQAVSADRSRRIRTTPEGGAGRVEIGV
jgi:hypothetical protein